jgi:hypothetical protein
MKNPWADVPDDHWVDVPGAGLVPGWVVNGSPTRTEEAAESAIRADERAKCRAELREKVDELIDTVPDWQFADRIFRWANGTEAFGGE